MQEPKRLAFLCCPSRHIYRAQLGNGVAGSQTGAQMLLALQAVVYSLYYIINRLFIFLKLYFKGRMTEKERQRERERETEFFISGSLSSTDQDCASKKPGARNFIQVCHTYGRCSNTWVIFYCFSIPLARN